MSVVFFVETKQNSAFLSLSGPVACHLLTALAYRIQDVAGLSRLAPEDLLPRIVALRRQFALGRGREFTAEEVGEAQVLGLLDDLEKMAQRAREGGRVIELL